MLGMFFETQFSQMFMRWKAVEKWTTGWNVSQSVRNV